MQAHRMRIVVPENHRAIIEFPEAIRSGPVELIVLVPSEDEAAPVPKAKQRGALAAAARELAGDPRSFHELSPDERSARIEKVMGVGRGLLSTSEEFARRKREETELEEKKLAR